MTGDFSPQEAAGIAESETERPRRCCPDEKGDEGRAGRLYVKMSDTDFGVVVLVFQIETIPIIPHAQQCSLAVSTEMGSHSQPRQRPAAPCYSPFASKLTACVHEAVIAVKHILRSNSSRSMPVAWVLAVSSSMDGT